MEGSLESAQKAAAARIPDLLRAASHPDAVTERMAFWNAYFRLPTWLLIARGSPEAPSPFVVVGAQPTLLVFSDAVGARTIGMAAGLPEAEASRILALPTPGAIDWVHSFAEQGVRTVQFDAHVDGAGIAIPIEHLPRMRADLLGEATA